MTQLSDNHIQAWARLLRAQQATLDHVEQALKQADLPPLIWYDILLELERAGPDGLRPYELEQELLLKQYGVSRLIKRIEDAGYLERAAHPKDRRGQTVRITPAGAKIRRESWPVYETALTEAVGDKLSSTEAKQLSGLLLKLMP